MGLPSGGHADGERAGQYAHLDTRAARVRFAVHVAQQRTARTVDVRLRHGVRRHARLHVQTAGEERRDAAHDPPRGRGSRSRPRRSSPSSMRAPGATVAPLPYWRPFANATISGRTSSASAVHLDGQVVGPELDHLADCGTNVLRHAHAGRGRSPQTAAPPARPDRCRPRSRIRGHPACRASIRRSTPRMAASKAGAGPAADSTRGPARCRSRPARRQSTVSECASDDATSLTVPSPPHATTM